MSSQLYCTCNRPNTRQTAFARANGFNCSDCNRTLNPDPNAETYQIDNSNQEEASSPIPNFFPPSPLSEHGSFPIPPNNYPNALAQLLGERSFDPPEQPAEEEGEDQFDDQNQEEEAPLIPIRSSSAPLSSRRVNWDEIDTQANQEDDEWPSPPQIQNPSPYQARTPTRIIEVDPFEIVSDNNNPQDEEADWDNFEAQQHPPGPESNSSDHSYQSLLSDFDQEQGSQSEVEEEQELEILEQTFTHRLAT